MPYRKFNNGVTWHWCHNYSGWQLGALPAWFTWGPIGTARSQLRTAIPTSCSTG
jgi:hypothetical protein